MIRLRSKTEANHEEFVNQLLFVGFQFADYWPLANHLHLSSFGSISGRTFSAGITYTGPGSEQPLYQ